MAIKIHHGPNGSYKTSGAVWDDAVPAARAGRLIITNVRGMSSEKFHSLFPDLPDTFDVMYINHEFEEGMERIRSWFQWAPRDAFLIFDEAQTLFPKKWTNKDLDKFDFPGGMDAAKKADRPMNFLDGWTRHRHWNWDIILTTPNIKYVHPDIRDTSEAAYQHSNLKLLGAVLKFLTQKDYKEAMHLASENRAPTDGSNIVALRKIDKRVFKLYDSTATGVHRDTMAGKNAFTSPRVLILLFVFLGVVGYLLTSGGVDSMLHPLTPKTAPVAPQTHKESVHEGNKQDSRVASDGVSTKQAPASGARLATHDPFSLHDITIKGSIWNDEKGIFYVFNLSKDGHSFNLLSKDMLAAGYQIHSRGACAAELTFDGEIRTVACLGSTTTAGGEERLGSERRTTGGGSSYSSSPGAQSTAQSVASSGSQRGANFNIVSDSSHMPRTLK
jgi:zona occludens toxin